MKKRWLFLVGLGLAVGAGCSSSVTEETGIQCTDGPDGGTYYCGSDELCCGGACVKETAENCGVCGVACGPGSVCQDGACICEQTGKFCSMTCVNNPVNGGCVDPMTNPTHCGGNSNNDCDPSVEVCGKACPVNGVCSNGVCAENCSGDLENCGGSCVDTDNNVLHCGSCHSACPLPDGSNNISRTYCLNGSCSIECQKGYADADGNLANGCESEVTFVCGNGIVEQGEMCDGLRLNDQTCASIVGMGSTGVLACRPDCMGFDATGCSASTTCGNGHIDGAEKCDGADLSGQTCETAVGAGSKGYLGCNSNCTDFDTSYCSAPTTCGNGLIDGSEMCDGTNVNGATCESIVGMGSQGTVKCSVNCSEFDKSGCTAAAVCGNGILEAGEDCDGNNFNGQTCSSLAGAGSVGNLTCSQCKISTAQCSAPSTCGDNIANGSDICDGTDLKGATCATVVGEGSTGTLACRENCTGYDISGCTAASHCGNGIVEPGEACDGSSLNDQTCSSQVGFGSTGTLRCDSKCQGFVTTGCSASTTCGNNGIIDAGEVCDMTNLRGATCENTVGAGSVGTVLCGADCKSLNLSGCSAPTLCGNSTLDEGEVCEGTNLNGATCESVVGAGSTGVLKCGDGCKHFDTTGCKKPHSCGDGLISDNEVCDPGAEGTSPMLAGRTCADVVGFGSQGVLACASNCMEFDTKYCTQAVTCGNGKLDAGEICDGSMLNGATCSSQIGFGSTGTLKCNDTCDGFDTSRCSEAKKCGNGVLDAGETCDGFQLNGRTCEQQVGYGSTGMPGCNSTCTAFTKGSCTPELTCGNGKINPGEQCDSFNLNQKTCADVMGAGSEGTLKCDSSCQFNTTLCSAPAGCGNGRLDSGEECDGKEFASDTTYCKEYKPSLYSAGKLSCTSDCRVDVSACTAYCGNGSLNTSVSGVYIGEACDGTRFPTASNSCEKVVGTGSTGTLQCSDDCKTIMTNQCTAPAYCGDGRVNQASELCDGSAFAGGSDDCSAFSSDYMAGNKVKCLGNCQLDVSACVAKPRCGDGIVNGDEECDINSFLLDENTCKGWDSKYESGNVTCNNTTCTVEYTNCKLPQPKCGNNKLDADEFCDGSLFFDGITCSDWLGTEATGNLKCTSACDIDDSGCAVAAPKCGDGKLDAGEDCDGSEFRESKTCKNIDPSLYSSGSATCTSDCKVDVSSCTTYCGNGSVNTTVGGVHIGEACDGTRFPTSSNTCAKVVGTGSEGTLKCSADCKSIDTTGCSDPVTEYCGDGIANSYEYCDGNDFADDLNTCEIWGYAGGTLKCKSNCDIDFSACTTAVPAYCGDGILNGADEYCDGKQFDEAWDTCEKANSIYSGGTLKCTSDCEVDESACILKSTSTCGNGKLDEDEWCDGSKFLDGITCQDAGSQYSGGTLKCTDDCELDLTACTLHRCGDNILSDDEWCDGSKFLDNMGCADVSSLYSGGTLKCTKTCEIDTSACQKRCGNGILDEGEWCDGNKFDADADACSDWIHDTTGTLTCTSTCEVDTSNCKAKPTAFCGDGVVNTDAEDCDGSAFLLDITDCKDYSNAYVGGKLSCNTSTCKVDTSACQKPAVAQCGDGKYDADSEYCDAGKFMFDIKTCAEYSSSYNTGMLKCTSDCNIDTSACGHVVENTCGNGRLDSNEFCDGNLFYEGVTDCTIWGELLDSEYVAGNVTCSANCEISTAACVAPSTATCGDGILNQANEECDKTAFELNVTSCAEYSNAYASGSLKCTNDCKVDTSACQENAASTCGNGILEGNEECDGGAFFLDVKTCAEYSSAYSHVTANLGCTEDCKVDETACRAGFCPENEILCAGDNNNDVVMCIDGTYQIVYDCKSTELCTLKHEDGVATDGYCEAIPVDVNLEWCTFHWFEHSNNTGYGRILMPEGMSDDDVLAVMACTNDLNKPVSDWKWIDAVHNTSCSDCYANQEYMTETSYLGESGLNYCTFLYMFNNDATYACRPQQTGASAPILIVDGVTKLTAELTRTFTSSACVESHVRCNGNVLEMCVDGVYGEVEACTGATVCDAAAEDCVSVGVSYDVTETMNDWTAHSSYSGENSTSHGDAGTISAVARVNTSSPLIDSKTAVLNGGSTYNTSITISGLKNGIGTLSFQYASWGKSSDSATLTITDGTKTETLSVKATDTAAVTKTITFNNKSASTVTIKPASGGRILIDNVRWTNAQ